MLYPSIVYQYVRRAKLFCTLGHHGTDRFRLGHVGSRIHGLSAARFSQFSDIAIDNIPIAKAINHYMRTLCRQGACIAKPDA